MPRLGNNLDVNKYQLLNAIMQQLASAPGSPSKGQFYFDTVNNVAWQYDGTAWQLMTVKATDSTITVAATGIKVAKTLDHTWITDFDTQVRLSRLDQMAAPTADVSLNTHKLTNVTDPSGAQDAATKNYVDGIAIAGASYKTAVRAATTAALAANTYNNGAAGVGATLTGNVNGALAAIDGYTPVAGDRILVKNEATAANNGIYSVTTVGTGSVPYVLTRVVDNDQTNEIANAATFVENGTVNGNQGFIVVGQGPYTIGTTAITWTQFTGAAELTAGTGITITGKTIALATLNGKAMGTFGDGATTTFNLAHNFGLANAYDALVQVWDISGAPYQQEQPDIYCVDGNTVRAIYGVAPATNTKRVVCVA